MLKINFIRRICYSLLFVVLSANAQTRDSAKINPNTAVTAQYFEWGMKYLNNPKCFTPYGEYANGQTKLIVKKDWVYDFAYCLLANPEKRRLFFGFVDYTEKDSPRLMFGTILEPSQDVNQPPIRIGVRFDMNIDLCTYREPEAPDGAYHFAQGVLDYRCADPKGKDMYDRNTAFGLVAQTPSGFYCEKLSWVDFLSFNKNGRGTARQHCTAEGREEYMSSYDKYGSRGGYKGTVNSSDAVEYDVTIDRTQPMTWSLTEMSDSHNKPCKLLKINYSAPSTPKISYKYATPHPVMTEIKNAYAKWSRSAPIRYVGSEEFIYCGKLPKWIVIRKVDSDWFKASSYLYVPVAGFQIETQSYFDPSQMIKTDVIPQTLAQDMIEEFIK